MFEEKCKKSQYEHLIEIDLKQNPCCFEKLIFLENFFDNKNLTKNFSDYLFKFIKNYYKNKLLSLKNLKENSQRLFLNLLIKYSSIFYFLGKIIFIK